MWPWWKEYWFFVSHKRSEPLLKINIKCILDDIEECMQEKVYWIEKYTCAGVVFAVFFPLVCHHLFCCFFVSLDEFMRTRVLVCSNLCFPFLVWWAQHRCLGSRNACEPYATDYLIFYHFIIHLFRLDERIRKKHIAIALILHVYCICSVGVNIPIQFLK